MSKLMACVLLVVLVACMPAPTPTPVPTPTPPPTVTPMPVPTTTVYENIGIPGCVGFAVLANPVAFSWEGLENVEDVGEWGYYSCTGPAPETAALYRAKMIKPPFNWQEFSWVEQPQGTLGVYFHAVLQKWVYLWFLPNPGGPGSVIVAAIREIAEPLELPCCG